MTSLREPRPGAHIQPNPRDIRECPDTFPKGRRCKTRACATIVSIYNPGPYCHCCARKLEAELLRAERERAARRAKRDIDRGLLVAA